MVKFIVDSTFGVSKEMAKEHDIKIVSLKLILDGVVEDEGFEETWNDFYKRFSESPNFPTTSQPNAESYIEAIEQIYAAEPDAEIAILTIASCLSGTINSAIIAKNAYEGKKIAVIDSMNATLACSLMIEELIEYTNSGKNLDEVAAYIEELKDRLSIQFIPDTMKYLKKGGRVGALSSLIANIISIKPIFDVRKNVVAVPQKALGLAKAITVMVKRLPENIKKLYVAYISNNKNVPIILEKLESILGLKNVVVRAVDPVFGIHVGIGAIGIACLEA